MGFTPSTTYSDIIIFDVLTQTLIGHKLIDNGFGGHHLGDDIAILFWHPHGPDQRDEQLREYPLEVDLLETHQVTKPTDQTI